MQIETSRALDGHVRVDPGQIIDKTVFPHRLGGVVTLRLTRARGVTLIVWTQFAYDLGLAFQALAWRLAERREGGIGER